MTREQRKARRDIVASRPKLLPVQLVVRCDQALHDALRADARTHGRTVAQSARFILRSALLPKDES